MNSVLRALLTECIDYAGLFPPAAVSMDEAVANYAAYRAGDDAWALGRFVVPVVRLDEFAQAAGRHLNGTPWRVAALAQASDADAIGAFNARLAGRAVVDTVESRAATSDEVRGLAPLATLASVYVEIPVREDPAPLVAAIASAGLHAKVRTGGVTADAFPSPSDVARFLAACARHRVRFKATAGLHHPLRGEFPLTYDAQAPRGVMFGYLNVFLAAAFARRGMEPAHVADVLDERDATAFRVTNAGVAWRGHTLDAAALAAHREAFAVSFGSCSFREPLDDLSTLPLS
ncbi:MAG: hypothetical protein FJ363_00585 [Gemmatimonadetes bacterium]|nr:hypothetical protein [Gemmatimonadota bacterium]